MVESRFDESSDERRWRVPEARQLESDAYHIWKPRPLLRSIHWRPEREPPRDVAATAYDVFLDQRAFVAMHDHVWNASPDDSPFGYLIGDLCEDPDSERRYLIVSGAVPSRFPLREGDAEPISGEADVALQLELDRRRGVLAGWYHSHRAGAAELSESDVATHLQMFGEPWHIALLFITDPKDPRGACFRRTSKGLSAEMPLPFYEMVSNESLLARGVRRSRLDWKNVRTEDAILPDPPPRPEPVEEVEEVEAGAELAVSSPVDSGDRPEAVQRAGEAVEEVEEELDLDALVAEIEASGAQADVVEDAPTPPEGALSESAPVLDLPGSEAEASEEIPTLLEPWETRLPELEPFVDAAAAPQGEGRRVDEGEEEAEAEAWPQREEAEPVEGAEEAEPELAEPPELSGESSMQPTPLPEEEVPEEEVSVAAGVAIIEPAAPRVRVRKRASRVLRSRQAWMIAGGVVVVAAIILSLITFVRTETGTEAPAASETAMEEAPGSSPGAAATAQNLPTEGATEATGGGEPGVQGGTETGAPPPTVVGGGAEAAAGGAGGGELTRAGFEALGDEIMAAISAFYGLKVRLDEGRATCAELQGAYVTVDGLWMKYNVEGKGRWEGRLPDDLAQRDERIYQGVRDVEREFNGSGCPRP